MVSCMVERSSFREMPFQDQIYWASSCVNDNEINGDSSSSELKRSHQWFMDGADVEAFPNKKQSVGFPTANFFSGLLNSNFPSWGNTSSFQSILSPLTDRLFNSESVKAVNFDNRHILSVSSEKVNMGRTVDGDSFVNDFPFGLSMDHTLEDSRPGLDFGGNKKVKVTQVKESEPQMPISREHAYWRVDNLPTTMPTHAFNKMDENPISLGLAYNKEVGNVMSMDETYERDDNIFISMGQTYSKSDEAISQNEASKENNNAIALNQTFSKGDDRIVYVGQAYNTDENSISVGQILHKGNSSTISTSQAYSKDNSSNLSVGRSYNKGESTIISFCGYGDDNRNPLSISSYELLMAQSSLQGSELIPEKEWLKTSADTLVCGSHITASGAENVSKKKEDPRTSKKISSNNFPSNVKSLLSTGMLDGVHVKYIAWSREKKLLGCIKGCGYLCGCQTCNYSKVINAYEFERHANCKTKHPNNHIYFESGKTIYGIVQELRSTPQNMLFEVIQTITGSPINQKAYSLWKESFLAATRELQRIYGQDEGTLSS